MTFEMADWLPKKYEKTSLSDAFNCIRDWKYVLWIKQIFLRRFKKNNLKAGHRLDRNYYDY